MYTQRKYIHFALVLAMLIFKRKLTKVGRSGIAVFLPIGWVRYYFGNDFQEKENKVEMTVNRKIVITPPSRSLKKKID